MSETKQDTDRAATEHCMKAHMTYPACMSFLTNDDDDGKVDIFPGPLLVLLLLLGPLFQKIHFSCFAYCLWCMINNKITCELLLSNNKTAEGQMLKAMFLNFILATAYYFKFNVLKLELVCIVRIFSFLYSYCLLCTLGTEIFFWTT